MRLIILVLTLSFLTTTGWAEVPVQQPVDQAISNMGYQGFPVLQCPATNELIKNYRKKLQDLKASIKAEANNCKGIEADVTKLSSLIAKDRPEFIDLIAKGQIGGLNALEQGKVESYVNELTVTTSNLLAVLTGNDACFDDEKKGASLEFITSLIGEGSKILSIVGGPQLGPIIGIAGEVITGFMKGMQTIKANRQGYKFEDADQRVAYAESLCTFFDYHRELENMVSPDLSIERLNQLLGVIEQQLSVLTAKCPECAELRTYIEAEFKTATENGQITIESANQIWPKAFEQTVAEKAKAIDALYTRKLGTHTYRSMKTRSWIPLRIDALQIEKFTPDVVLGNVVLEKSIIEKFMVDDQGAKFVKQLIRNAEYWEKDLVRQVTNGTFMAYELDGTYIEPAGGSWSWNYTSPDEYYGKVFEALENAKEKVSASDRKKINTFFKDIEAKSRSLNISLDIAMNYCNFFGNADWYRDGISYQCSSENYIELQKQALRFSNYRMLMPSNLENADVTVVEPVVVAEPETFSIDWVDSLRLTVESMSTEIDYVERKN